MDKVLADTLTANLKAAHTPDEKQSALVLAMIAVVDCQLKTASRVNQMWDERSRIAWVGRAVYGLATGGGFAVIVKVMKTMGVL